MMKRRHALGLAAGIAAAGMAAAPLGAQSGPPQVGETVRLYSPSMTPPRVRGQVMTIRGDTLFVLPADGTGQVAVPADDIAWIDVRRRRTWGAGLVRGALIGAPVGAAGGFLGGVLAEAGKEHCPDCGLTAILGGMLGLVSGTVIGAMVGAGAPGEGWEPTAPPIIESAPAPGGVALSMRIKL
jgi:hypothetical protein